MNSVNEEKEHVVTSFDVPVMDILKHFPVFGDTNVLFSLLEQYEAYRKTTDMPGDIVIIGKNIAVPLINIANFTEAQTIGDRTRLIFAFDEIEVTEAFPDKTGYVDLAREAMDLYDMDRFVGWKPRIKLQRGPVEDMLGAFLKKHIGLKANLVFLCNLSQKQVETMSQMLSGHVMARGRILEVNTVCEKHFPRGPKEKTKVTA